MAKRDINRPHDEDRDPDRDINRMPGDETGRGDTRDDVRGIAEEDADEFEEMEDLDEEDEDDDAGALR